MEINIIGGIRGEGGSKKKNEAYFWEKFNLLKFQEIISSNVANYNNNNKLLLTSLFVLYNQW